MKMVVVSVVFVALAAAIRLQLGNETLLLGFAVLVAISPYFVRCETCKSSIYYRTGGQRMFPAGPSALKFMFSRKCPYCGHERR
jgi:hypothetical protein